MLVLIQRKWALLIRRLSINVTLKSLLLVVRIEKSSKSGAWLKNKRCFFMAESSSVFTLFPASAEIPKCFHILTLKMKFSFAIIDSRQPADWKFQIMPECKNDRILSLNIKQLQIWYLVCRKNRTLQFRRNFFIVQLNPVRIWRDTFPVTKSFLGTALNPELGSSILSKTCLMHLSTKSRV